MNGPLDKESILARFGQWLEETGTVVDSIGAEESLPEVEGESAPVGLYQLVEQFIALRHELKLQTKGSRNLAEQTEVMLKEMQEAIEVFRSAEARESQAARRAAAPLVESLIDLDESLQRGRTVIETARRRFLEDLSGELQEQLDLLFRGQSAWRRWLCRRWHRAAREILQQRAALGYRQIFDSLIEGYGLIIKRLDRTMNKEGIYRIQCLGKPVDPNTMTVVEALDDPLQPPGLVVEEVRPGYYWKDKVIRFAEVRAVGGKTF